MKNASALSLRAALFELVEFLRAHQAAGQAALGFLDQAVPMLVGRFIVVPTGVMAGLMVEHDVTAVKACTDLPFDSFVVGGPPAKFHGPDVVTGAAAASAESAA